MDVRRIIVMGGVSLGVVLAGCGGSSGGGVTGVRSSALASATKTTAPPASPTAESSGQARAALAAAARRLGDDSMRMSLTLGTVITGGGTADPTTKAMHMSMRMRGRQAMTVEVRHTGKDVYIRVEGRSFGSLADQWMHIGGDRIPTGLGVGSAEDPGDAQRLLQTVVDVHRDGPGRFRGTLDMSKSPQADPAAIERMGASARAVPFTAEVDEQGRLVGLRVRMDAVAPSMPALQVRYSDFGTPVRVTKPKGRIIEAPQQMVDAMGG